MKALITPAILAGLASVLACGQDGRIPVIVELFTSEGCSSCPPADALLARLERNQPVPGARVIALEEHVDYWNQLGWVDPFSSALYRVRQNDYARLFEVDNVFTPQMIVGGQAGFIGNDADRAFQEILRAAARQLSAVELRTARNARNPELLDLLVQVSDRGARGGSDVYMAVTEDNLSTNVLRGENSGKMLRHAPVVRSFGVIGKFEPRKTNEVHLTPTLQLPKEWKRDNLRAVVFVQERGSRKITGAGAVDLR
jgi:hypothetical protein